MIIVRRARTTELTRPERIELHRLLVAWFGDEPDQVLTAEDWEHALGGIHVLVEDHGAPVAHAAVVERTIEPDGRPTRTGYVEAVAVRPDRRREGLGSRLMEDVGAIIRDGFELGMLGTGVQPFYERLGWRTWRGPSGVREPGGGGIRPTPEDDGYLMVLGTATSPTLDLDRPIVCDWRPGDVW